jgi:hypothetical protein
MNGDPQKSSPSANLVVTSNLNFGNVVVGGSKTLSAVVSNRSFTHVTISQAASSDPQFQIVAPRLPLTMRAGQTVRLTVRFTPQSAGTPSGTLVLTSNASQSLRTILLSAKAIAAGKLTPNANSIAFGSVRVGQQQTKTATFTNSGSTTLSITQVQVSGASFQLSGTATLPVSVDPGQSHSFSVIFSPKSAGASSGSMTLASAVSMAVTNHAGTHTTGATEDDSTTVTLSGTGTAQGQLAANPASVSFGNMQVGASASRTVLINNSGSASVTVSQAAASGTGFTASGMSFPATIPAGQSASINVTFAPKAAGNSSGTLVITSNSSNPTLSVGLSGSAVTPGSLSSNTSLMAFGTVEVGSNQKQSATVTNNGGSSVTINQAAVTGNGFTLSGITAPLSLAAGQSATFTVTFAPRSAGNATGSVTLTPSAGAALSWSLSGSGVTEGALTATPSSLSFGSIDLGESKSLSESLTNSGGSSVTISQISASGTGFSVSGVTLPATLDAGQSLSFNVAFNPAGGGNASSVLTITSTASNGSLTVPLSGSATTPGTLTLSSSSLSFGAVQTSSSKTMQETVSNTGGSSVTITQAGITGPGFTVSGLSLPLTLAAGTRQSFNVIFAPQSASSANGSLTITSDASNSSIAVALSGTGTAASGVLSASPLSVNFGSVQVGDTSTRSGSFSNTGGSTVTISQVNTSGTGFGVTGLSLPLDLDAGESFTFGITFSPQSAGSASGSIAVVSTASNTLTPITLSGSGTAVGQFGLTPTSFSFGSVMVGASKNMTATLTASGASVTVSSASVSSSEFKLTGPSLPMTIATGQSATFTITFTPQSSGSATATASFVTNAPGSPATATLAGSGTQPPQHRVDLNWSPSASDVVGYNIYRSTTSGNGYSKLNSSANAGTSFSDSSVVAGSTYFYVTTAVDSSGTESSFSNEVRAVIPTP